MKNFKQLIFCVLFIFVNGYFNQLCAEYPYILINNPPLQEQLQLAARDGDAHTIRELVKDGLDDIDAKNSNLYTTRKITPLMQAAERGHIHAVEALLENHASLSLRDSDELTALECALKAFELLCQDQDNCCCGSICLANVCCSYRRKIERLNKVIACLENEERKLKKEMEEAMKAQIPLHVSDEIKEQKKGTKS
jgi:hypothetical protein